MKIAPVLPPFVLSTYRKFKGKYLMEMDEGEKGKEDE